MLHLAAFLIKFGLFLTTWRGFEIWVIRREGDSTCGDPIGCTLQAYLIGVHLISLYLTGVYLTGVHLAGVHLTGVHFTGVHFTGVHLTGVKLIGVYLTGVLTGVHLTRASSVHRWCIASESQGVRTLIVFNY